MNVFRQEALVGFINIFRLFGYRSSYSRNEQISAVSFSPEVLPLLRIEKSQQLDGRQGSGIVPGKHP